MRDAAILDRRAMLCAGLGALGSVWPGASAFAAPASHLAFEIWRNERRIGSHTVSIEGDRQAMTVVIMAEMAFGFGLIPIRYRHDARETWRDGAFAEFASTSVTDGIRDRVTAHREGDAISLVGSHGGPITAPANVHPLTHWNSAVLDGPLFNPQTGAMLNERITRTPGQTVTLADGRAISATGYALTGPARITDWYDGQDAWTGLHGRLPDGSWIDYRRVS